MTRKNDGSARPIVQENDEPGADKPASRTPEPDGARPLVQENHDKDDDKA